VYLVRWSDALIGISFSVCASSGQLHFDHTVSYSGVRDNICCGSVNPGVHAAIGMHGYATGRMTSVSTETGRAVWPEHSIPIAKLILNAT